MTISATTKMVVPASTRLRSVLFSVGASLLANLVLWLVGLAAGGSFELTDGGTTTPVAPGGVVMLTVVPIVVGMGLAALISLRWIGVIRIAQVVGVLAPLGTIAMTIDADFDAATTVTLALMHVVIAIVVPIGLESMRRGAA